MGVLAKRDAMRAFRATLGLLLAPAASPALADWHAGKVTQLAIGYDGSTITFLNRSNCTCYSPWPGLMCLDRTRATHKEEFAMLLRARATATDINVHIDEGTCRVVALYEVG